MRRLVLLAFVVAALPVAAQEGTFGSHAGGQEPASGVVDGPGAAPPAVNPLAGLRAEALTGLSGRPLFSPTRRPPAVVAEEVVVEDEPAPEPAAPPALVLVGIVGAGEQSFAMVRDDAGGTVRTVREGDDVDGWRINLVAPDHVIIGDGEREETLRLFVAGSRPEAADDEDATMDLEGEAFDDVAADIATADGEELLDMIRTRR